MTAAEQQPEQAQPHQAADKPQEEKEVLCTLCGLRSCWTGPAK